MQTPFSSLRFGTKEAYARDSVGASATSALRARVDAALPQNDTRWK
jgi:hypothetical protein